MQGLSRPPTEEIKLYDSSRERQRLEELSELYAIIKATEMLEAAFIRDAVAAEEYTAACNRIISQFKTTEAALIHRKEIESADSFFKEFQVDCPKAYERLVVTGVPATVIFATGSDSRGETVIVAETVQQFITAMDALRLGQKAVDEVQPLISDLTGTLVRVPNLPSDFQGCVKMRNWLNKLNEMRAADEIDEEECRQLLHDLDSSYNAFIKHLNSKGK